MSRGLSQQQRQVLGIAAHVNRLTQGGQVAVKTGAPVANWLVPTVDYPGVKDLHWSLPAHLLKGLAFVEANTAIEKSNGVWQRAGVNFDLTTGPARSAKASILRAITSLAREGFLVDAPEGIPFSAGYVLTEAGLTLGVQQEYPFPPVLIFRAGLVMEPNWSRHEFHRIAGGLAQGLLTLPTILELRAHLPPALERWERSHALYAAVQTHLSARDAAQATGA